MEIVTRVSMGKCRVDSNICFDECDICNHEIRGLHYYKSSTFPRTKCLISMKNQFNIIYFSARFILVIFLRILSITLIILE